MTFLLIITTIFTGTGFFGKLGYFFDLTAHFRAQYFFIQLLCVFLYFSRRRWKFFSIALLAALTNLILIAPLYIPSANVHVTDGKSMSIMLINVNSYNNEYDKVITYVNQIKPDILALEEINDEWIAALSSLLSGYPYKEFQSRTDNFGIGLYSRIPVESMKTIGFSPLRVPSILAQYRIDNEAVTLLFTHTMPPRSFPCYQYRNEHLRDIAAQRTAFGENLILVGDLNTTSWSYHFNDFIKKMALIDTRRGFGLQISWPTVFPLMGIAIDHVLVSKSIKVFERRIGPHIGSDHYPVYIRLGMRGSSVAR